MAAAAARSRADSLVRVSRAATNWPRARDSVARDLTGGAAVLPNHLARQITAGFAASNPSIIRADTARHVSQALSDLIKHRPLYTACMRFVCACRAIAKSMAGQAQVSSSAPQGAPPD